MSNVSDSQRDKKVWTGSIVSHIKLPIIVMLAILSTVFWMWQWFLVPQSRFYEKVTVRPAKLSSRLILTYPNYVAGGDRGYIDVTLCNEAERPISGSFVVNFYHGDRIVCMGCSEKNEVEFKNLAPRVRQTQRIHFVLNEVPSVHLQTPLPSVNFDVRVVDKYGNGIVVFPKQTIRVAPIPYLRTLLGGEFVFALLAIPIGLLSDWLKKSLIPEQS